MTDFVFNAVSLVLIVGVLAGIRLLSSPRTAVAGNLLGSLCMLAAVVLTLLHFDVIDSYLTLSIGLAVGAAIGAVIALRVAMVQMPQLVALLNGFGGAASALVALNLLAFDTDSAPLERLTGGLALAVGTLTLAGSLLAAAKLAAWVRSKPVRLPMHGFINMGALAVAVLLSIACAFELGGLQPVVCVLLIAAAALFGLAMTMRIGGADMPIVISLLNSLSGVAAAVAGFAIASPLLVATGGIVGAAGLILTQGMCRAMNRSLAEVLSGFSPAPAAQRAKPAAAVFGLPTGADGAAPNSGGAEATRTEPDAPATRAAMDGVTPEPTSEPQPKADLSALLREAKKVIVVPGYGMAVAQAQQKVKQLADRLEAGGCEVNFAIHPVAGRMPGHMNVLLAEVDVDYDKLWELDDANAAFPHTDLAIVVGANDVVNPAANTAEGTPIYGMPVLNVAEARHVAICNLDRKPGYAGVDNPLYDDPRVTLLLGDAGESVDRLLSLLAT